MTRFSNGVQEWRGNTSKGGRFVTPYQPTASLLSSKPLAAPAHGNSPQSVFAAEAPHEEIGGRRQDAGTVVETLDLKRVEDALATLLEEQDIADAMAGKPPRERHHRWTTPNDRNAARNSGNRNSNRTPMVAAPDVVDSVTSGASTTPGHSETENQLLLQAGDMAERGSFEPDALLDGDTKKSERNRKMREVFAVYKHRGAQLVLAQSRKKHPFRVDGMFCRPDRGEWAGQVTDSFYRSLVDIKARVG